MFQENNLKPIKLFRIHKSNPDTGWHINTEIILKAPTQTSIEDLPNTIDYTNLRKYCIDLMIEYPHLLSSELGVEFYTSEFTDSINFWNTIIENNLAEIFNKAVNALKEDFNSQKMNDKSLWKFNTIMTSLGLPEWKDYKNTFNNFIQSLEDFRKTTTKVFLKNIIKSNQNLPSEKELQQVLLPQFFDVFQEDLNIPSQTEFNFITPEISNLSNEEQTLFTNKLNIAKEKMLKACDKIETYGYTPVFIFLQGSQNYNLDTPSSDFDFKAIVSKTDYFGNDTLKSKTIELDLVKQSLNHEGFELLDVKDIDNFEKVMSKTNPSYIEYLFSIAVLINKDFSHIIEPLLKPEPYNHFSNKMLASNAVEFAKGILGFFDEKIHALSKPFASKVGVVSEYGYDPKQLHHLERLNFFWEKTTGLFFNNNLKDDLFNAKEKFNPYWIDNKEIQGFLKDIKTKPPPKTTEEVLELKEFWSNKSKYYRELFNVWREEQQDNIANDVGGANAFIKQNVILPMKEVEQEIQIMNLYKEVQKMKVLSNEKPKKSIRHK